MSTNKITQLEEENARLNKEIEALKSDSSMKDLLEKVRKKALKLNSKLFNLFQICFS